MFNLKKKWWTKNDEQNVSKVKWIGLIPTQCISSKIGQNGRIGHNFE